MTNPIRVFIGSSTEQLPVAEKLAQILESAGHKTVGWWEDEVFPAGSTTMASLRRISKVVDAAIFVFSEDDKVWFRDKDLGQPRDNVLIEYGLFLGALGVEKVDRVVFCRVGPAKVATDIIGVTYIPYTVDRAHQFKNRVLTWANLISPIKGPRNGTATISSSKTKADLFRSGEHIVRRTNSSLLLCARTPVPIVGTRPYDEGDEAELYEKEQLAAYDEIVGRIEAGEDLKFVIVGCLDLLRKEILEDPSSTLAKRVEDRLSKIYHISTSSAGRLSVRWYTGSGITTFVTGDNNSIIWFKKTNHENVWFSLDDDSAASALRQQTMRVTRSMTLDEVMKFLKAPSD